MSTNQLQAESGREISDVGEYVDTSTAARLSGISASTLSKFRMRGDGPPFCKLSKQMVRYHLPTLRAWLESRVHQSTSEYPSPPANWKKRDASDPSVQEPERAA